MTATAESTPPGHKVCITVSPFSSQYWEDGKWKESVNYKVFVTWNTLQLDFRSWGDLPDSARTSDKETIAHMYKDIFELIRTLRGARLLHDFARLHNAPRSFAVEELLNECIATLMVDIETILTDPGGKTVNPASNV